MALPGNWGKTGTDCRRVILFCLAVSVCLALSDAHEEEDHAPVVNKGVRVERNVVLLDKSAWDALGPQFAQVERRTLVRTILATGQLVAPPDARAWAGSWLSGRVEQLLVELGQMVQAGQVIAWVRSADWEKLLADLTVAQMESASARIEWERIDKLHREGLASRRDWLEARARWQQEENALLVNRLLVAALAGEVVGPGSMLPVRSPITGRVARIFTSPGRDADPHKPIAEILGDKPLWFRAQVPQYYAPLVQLGQSARVRLRAFPKAGPFSAKVFARSGRIDPKTLTETVWLVFDEPTDQVWRPGLQGVAQIEVQRRENVLAVPASAVIREGMDAYVFVAKDPAECPECCEPTQDHDPASAQEFQPYLAFQRVVFATGLETPDWVEVVDGIAEGQRVVVTGRHQLAILLPSPGGGEFRITPLAWKQWNLQVQPACLSTVVPVVTLEGCVAALPTTKQTVNPPLAGKLHRLLVAMPGPVRAGQPVAEIASLELQQWQLAWLQAELAAQAQREILQGYRELVATGAPLPEQVLRTAELAAQSAQTQAASWKLRLTRLAGLTEAQLNGLLLKHELTSCLTLRAAQDGWLVPSDLAVGQFLTGADSAVEILSDRAWFVRARVPEPMWQLIQPGAVARFRPAIVGQPIWLAKIVRVEDAPEENGQRYAWAQLLEKHPLLRENLTGTLTVEAHPQSAPKLVVPVSALWWEGTQAALFVYHREQDVFEYRPVVVGLRNDLWAEIVHGLRAGEEVAVSNIPGLRRHYGRIRSGQGITCDHCRD